MNLAQFLNSISIEGAGELTFDLMMEEGYNTIEKINGMTIQQIADVGRSSKRTIGEKTAGKIRNSLHSDRVRELLQYKNLWVKEEFKQDMSDALSIQVEDGSELKIDVKGKKVLFTGSGFFSRSALTAILKRNGAIVQSSVTKETDILILEDLDSISNKARKARKYGTKMVTYKDVFGE